ncbi:YhgE/Pip domain-containing protein [Kitasatospora sp. NPDC096147]|uniref:YhgE/Pip domain-containing protein n=1 Tax=Kitasatospora sp. NPDC096147 TaxID=3364093 RepID=UPI00382060AB
MSTAIPPSAPDGRASAARVLRRWKLWIAPGVLSALVTLVLSLLYMGGILTPSESLDRLPIAVVNSDAGAPLPGQQTNLGTQVAAAVSGGTPEGQVEWRQLDRAAAQDQLDSGKVYGALLVPEDFTATVAGLTTTQATVRPALTVLTNPGMGSLGSSLASQITQKAARQVSVTVGQQLTASQALAGAAPTTKLLLADPVEVRTQVGHPIGARTGLGLSAFYYTLLLVLAGFLCANIVHSGVDTALGYADTEIGPWHTRRPTLPISRTKTLVIKMVMTAGLSVLTTSLIMFATITILGMDAPHGVLLWLFSYCACLSVGLGVQAINAAFGSIGQLVAMFVFIALALPSSGATVPLEAVPGFYRFLAVFEPMRQLASGVRSILYFDARADAGLTRGWIMIGIGLVVGVVFGFAMTRYYDRKGLDRMVPAPGPHPA